MEMKYNVEDKWTLLKKKNNSLTKTVEKVEKMILFNEFHDAEMRALYRKKKFVGISYSVMIIIRKN